MIDKIKSGTRTWAHLNILLLLMMLIVRIIFFVETTTRIDTDIAQFSNIILGYKYDLLLAAHFIAWISPLFLLLYYFFPKSTTKTYKVIIFIYAIASTLLTEYFCNLMMPLDHVIFAYSIEGLKGAMESSTSFSIVPILFFIISIALFVIAAKLWNKVKTGNIFSYILIAISLVISISFNYKDIIQKERYSKNHADFILATNQPSYSYIKINEHLKNKKKKNETGLELIYDACERYHDLNSQFLYPYEDYPFYRKADYNDVIGPFLNKTENSANPNFVFIILESFGQCLTGAENPTISFTPFIDSLKNESLYWSNCLSTTERTFGVLPAIFASVPHGDRGFADRHSSTPPHNSLLRDFKKNHYSISYYYGCYRDIDRYDKFLKHNKVEKIFVPTQASVDEEVYEMMQKNNRWGLDDKELFDIAINNRKSSTSERPYVDIIMSLSTHEPFFLMEGTEKYEQMAKEILDKTDNVSKKEKNIVSKNLNVYACYMYMDECVKNLINAYKETPGYENTIFVITGDHRMGMLTTGNVLRSFNVPLLIYSPLLKNDRQMKAVVSHYDITPTINAYLSNNYNYNVGEYCHWLGTSLDTSITFRSNVKQAFMLNNRDVIDYINGEYFLCRSNLYKIDDDLTLNTVENKKLHSRFQRELDDYNLLGNYALKSNFLNNENDNDMINIGEFHYDFDKKTNDIFDNISTDSLGNKLLHIKENDEYTSLYPYLEIDNDYSSFSIYVSFDLKSYNKNKLPLLIYHIGDFYQAMSLVSILNNESLNTGELEHYVGRIMISKGKSFNGEKLKIYLRNVSGNEMTLDNIDLIIKASK